VVNTRSMNALVKLPRQSRSPPRTFDAIIATLPLGVGFEPKANAKGERLIWLGSRWVNKLARLRWPGESP
jgi:hypothetical protein